MPDPETSTPGPGSPEEPPPGADHAPGRALSETEAELLKFETNWWKYAGAKESAIRDRFAMSPTRYYQVLNALIDRTEALEYDPVTVHRLRRLRDDRRRSRLRGGSSREA